jgi:chromosome segregation ATPase
MDGEQAPEVQENLDVPDSTIELKSEKPQFEKKSSSNNTVPKKGKLSVQELIAQFGVAPGGKLYF